MELLDVYDAAGVHLGVKRRDEVHRDGDWHRCFHLWVRARGGWLFQRRAHDKDAFPGMLDATAAGHLTAGESVADGLREVEEELGVTWSMDELTELGVFRVEDHPTPGTTNREFQHVYTVRDERPLREWTAFDRAEVAGLVLVPDDGGPAIEWDGEHERTVQIEPGEIVPAPYLGALGMI